jgi:hypothetical protein
MAAFTIMSGLTGGAIGFYKSKSDFVEKLKDYRTQNDCTRCSTRIKVESMEVNYKDMSHDIKETTKIVSNLFTKVAVIDQKQEEILKQIKELKEREKVAST